MKKYAWFCMVLALGFVGCPATDDGTNTGDYDNPATFAAADLCAPICAKYQECNTDVFNLKWGTLEACELACSPATVQATCTDACDANVNLTTAQHTDCIYSCTGEFSIVACKERCVTWTFMPLEQCEGECDRQFSQACATVKTGIWNCYLNLECSRAIEYKGLGGSASDLGECTNDDGISTSC